MYDARTLTHALGGKWHSNYGVAFCPAHNNTATPALSIGTGRDGRLLLNCKAGCKFGDVAAALRDRGLSEHAGSPKLDYKAQQASDDLRRTLQAKQVARETIPIVGTIAETYLRTRSITCPLPEDALRFHPNCWHSSGKDVPAMVARVKGSDGYAVHRVYLKPDGAGKADVQPTKAMLGLCKGGAVQLFEAEGPLVVCEGLETALSLASGLLQRPATIWAALSTSGMQNLRLPPTPARLTIATDGDDAGRAAAQKLAERAYGLGWTVSFLHAPVGKDWNDVLREGGKT
jgi:Toprim domain